jgi:malate dehydrogenase
MVDAILNDKKKILPCCVLAKGEYGIDNIFVGLPVVLGSKGVEKIFEIKLTKKESEELKVSASHVKELCDHIDKTTAK